uniref:Iron-sulfur cluster formation ABC transporter n=1 Tax=Nitzschia sp. NIES-3576 TaxID=2083273 RepID=A0A2Z5ZAH4_9STRA|nr:iron-sulfur cluster formation ABC transporter [Nitzschia sp. NIES-3576]
MKNKNVEKFLNNSYPYGFSTHITQETIRKGLDTNVIQLISIKKKEPPYLTRFRLKAYYTLIKMNQPEWGYLKFPQINFQDIIYYSAPKFKNNFDTNSKILKTFEKLGLSLNDQKNMSNIAIDAVFDSVSVITTFKEKLMKYGIIFTSISDAIKQYPILIEKYLGSVVPKGDNFFSALNSAVFTDGSFCFIPQDTVCPMDLSTYFRINNSNSGQFERTLIIAEKNSRVNYLEGCTASQHKKNQLHAAIVEIVALENSIIKYSTVQNWYSGNLFNQGGIFNFVTKRGSCIGKKSRISWVQVETGSAITWKYPSCVLIGNNSQGEFYSVALTKSFQQADTGSKMIHIGKKSRSKIISKGISTGKSRNTYRGLIFISNRAFGSRNYSQCDSLLIGNSSNANTFPDILAENSFVKIEHEASTSKIGEDQIFYFLQRGIPLEKAIELMINGFCQKILMELPLEFFNEANKLLTLELEGSIG